MKNNRGRSGTREGGKRRRHFSALLRKKMRGRGGFSLSELMICVLLLFLTGGVIINTLELGVKQFQQETLNAEAELLCNSLSVAVRDRLTYAISYSSQLDFRTAADGKPNTACGLKQNDDGQLVLDYGGTPYPLVAPENYIRRGTQDYLLQADVSIDGKGSPFTVTVTVSKHGGGSGRTYTKTFEVFSMMDLSDS